MIYCAARCDDANVRQNTSLEVLVSGDGVHLGVEKKFNKKKYKIKNKIYSVAPVLQRRAKFVEPHDADVVDAGRRDFFFFAI